MKNLTSKLVHELKGMGVAMLFFGLWIGGLALLKTLLLDEYHVVTRGVSLAVVGVLVLSKVVLVLEHASLGSWVRNQPAWVDVLLRTGLYAMGVLVVLWLEKAWELRREAGSFHAALLAVPRHTDSLHVWVNAICLTGALLAYNLLSVVRQHLGEGRLARMLVTPLPPKPEMKRD